MFDKIFPTEQEKNVFKFAKIFASIFASGCILNMVTVINVASESGIIQTETAAREVGSIIKADKVASAASNIQRLSN